MRSLPRIRRLPRRGGAIEGQEIIWGRRRGFERFGQAHIDLARLLAAGGFGGAVTPSLHEIACACGIPGKLDHNGANGVDLWQGGHFAELTAYNETDACTTYLLWLRAANFQGLIPARELAQEVSAFRALIARRAAVRPEFARFQRAWTALDAPTPRDWSPPSRGFESLITVTSTLWMRCRFACAGGSFG